MAIKRVNSRFPARCPGRNGSILSCAVAHNTMIDAAGGLILDKLDALGLTENTLVIWTSDHGDALASHGGRFDKGSYMTEEVVRVPLAIRHPARIKPNQQLSQFVSGVDIPVTILDAAGTAFRSEVDGRTLLPLCTDADVTWRDDLLDSDLQRPISETFIAADLDALFRRRGMIE